MYNKHNLAVVGAVGNDHYAKAVFFSDRGTLATDGHIAVSVSMPENHEEQLKEAPLVGGIHPSDKMGEFEVPADDVKTIIKAIPKSAPMPILSNAFVLDRGGERSLATTNLSSVAEVKIKDPESFKPSMRDISKLVPDRPPVLTICLGGQRLARFVDILNKAKSGDRWEDGIYFTFYDDRSPVVARTKNGATGQDILGLIMPRNPGK